MRGVSGSFDLRVCVYRILSMEWISTMKVTFREKRVTFYNNSKYISAAKELSLLGIILSFSMV